MKSIREHYLDIGVEEFYKNSKDYTNPHTDRVVTLLRAINRVFIESYCDLSCGDGLVTSTLKGNGYGIDPFLHEVYMRKTGKECYPYDFMTLCMKYDIRVPSAKSVIISYAYDLVPIDLRELLVYRLKQHFQYLITIRPNNKKINLPLLEEMKVDQTRLKIYQL